ncbi:D,D-carboxypeptidase/D,D-dipeptidase VanXY [Vagococcus sp. BWB3-3]|uniref:D,D-carboxypeptidase/D,D-dipeptidase VanXY n=1 Tax=Vagococcus allomyrinae TaxID=2794353 RepID=A0A940P2B4_9ENTE|nr:D,D-carboxypeptidase/D,D-dipeptidase VanXY [Vagococcus allomyrinae]MBP1040159.1 D,D-carboxypeptidase/D,D-dipeptidase VanXY [Vagococcus allomyrinae]
MRNIFLQLVNRKHPMKKVNEPDQLVTSPFSEKKVSLQPEVAKQFQSLVVDLELANEIVLLDGYRTAYQQKKLWQFSLAENGREYTEEFVALPGCSEHQTGLALDIGLKGAQHDLICPNFQESPIVTKFRQQMMNYGFILRYPQEKQEITGIGYEPWHFRYVGLPHSQIIENQGWTLEEYLSFLQQQKGLDYD